MTTIEVTPTMIEDIRSRLLNGESTTKLSREIGLNNGRVWQIATAAGLVFKRTETGSYKNGRWAVASEEDDTGTEYDVTNMFHIPEQMPIDTYEALVEREPRTVVDPEPTSDIYRELEEMRALVEQATKMVSDTKCERDDMRGERDAAKKVSAQLENQVRELQAQVDGYKRQDDLRKIDISRRLLRQAGDDLRSAMAVGS